MDRLTERISALEERLRSLKARHTQSAARARTIQGRRERKEDTRRKILAGAWVLGQVERGELSRESLQRSLDRYLTRPEDRVLFGLSACVPAPPVGQPLRGGAPPEEATGPVSARGRWSE